MDTRNNPAFDLSTVLYAELALRTLLENSLDDFNRKEGRTQWRLLLGILRELDASAKDNPGGIGSQLEAMWCRLTGSTQSVLADGYYPNDRTEVDVVQFIFGMTCLAQVLEAIVLSEQVFFIGGHYRNAFLLGKVAPCLEGYDSADVSNAAWRNYEIAESENLDYAKWIKTRALDEKIAAYCTSIANKCFSTPLLDLVGWLYNGSATVLETDFITPSSWVATEHAYVPPKTPWATASGFGVRIPGYFVSSLYYQRICLGSNLQYTWNAVRAPFMQFLGISSGPDAVPWNRFDAAIKEFIGVSRGEGADTKRAKAFDPDSDDLRRYYILGLILYEAETIFDIVPAAYRLRSKLAQLRNHYSVAPIHALHLSDLVNDWQQLMSPDVQAMVSYKGVGLRFNVRLSSFLRKLYWPLYFGKRSYLNSAFTLIEAFAKVYSLTDRLSHLHAETVRRLRARDKKALSQITFLRSVRD